jgi:hypothetical protein
VVTSFVSLCNLLLVYLPVPYQDNSWDCGVFVCKYSFALYKICKDPILYSDAYTSPPLCQLITENNEFDFGPADIKRFRDEMAKLVDNLSAVYLSRKKSSKDVKPVKGEEVAAETKSVPRNVEAVVKAEEEAHRNETEQAEEKEQQLGEVEIAEEKEPTPGEIEMAEEGELKSGDVEMTEENECEPGEVDEGQKAEESQPAQFLTRERGDTTQEAERTGSNVTEEIEKRDGVVASTCNGTDAEKDQHEWDGIDIGPMNEEEAVVDVDNFDAKKGVDSAGEEVDDNKRLCRKETIPLHDDGAANERVPEDEKLVQDSVAPGIVVFGLVENDVQAFDV